MNAFVQKYWCGPSNITCEYRLYTHLLCKCVVDQSNEGSLEAHKKTENTIGRINLGRFWINSANYGTYFNNF